MALARVPAEHEQRRARHQRIAPHRGLAARAVEDHQPDEIDQSRTQARAGSVTLGYPGPDEPLRDPADQERGPRRDERGGDLVHQDAVAADAADGSEDQEQPDRLAIEDVDERPCAVQQAIADQQIELLVAMDHRVAEERAADREGHE